VDIADVPAVVLTVVKSTTTPSLPEPGGTFSYSVSITNGSTVDTATVATIVDDVAGALTNCEDAGLNPIALPYDLPFGETITCDFTFDHLGNFGDSFSNTVTVVALDDDGDPVGDSSNPVMVDIADVPAVVLTVVKSTTTPSLPEPGGTFSYSVSITNGSTVDTATVATIVDDVAGALANCEDAGLNPIALPYDLPFGETIACDFTFDHVGIDGDSFSNTVTVVAVDDDGAAVGNDSNTVTVDITPPPASAPPSFVGFAGDQITWSTVGGATKYHLYRGDLDVLVSTGACTQDPATVPDADRFCNLTTTEYTDPFVPVAGQVIFYLITSEDALDEGSLGENSNGLPRPNDNPCE